MPKHELNLLDASRWHYAKPAVLLHWVLAVLIASLLGIGWYMMSVEDEPGSDWYFDIHKSLGIIVFGLVMLRILWRAGHHPAPLPTVLPGWQVRLSHLTEWALSHLTEWALYVCMFLMPVLGFLGASYSKSGGVFFGAALPPWTLPNHDTAELFFGLHSAVAWVLVGLIGLHAAGGLKHLLIDKDEVFQRMWFR